MTMGMHVARTMANTTTMIMDNQRREWRLPSFFPISIVLTSVASIRT
jgi:hypothetical protein